MGTDAPQFDEIVGDGGFGLAAAGHFAQALRAQAGQQGLQHTDRKPGVLDPIRQA